MGLTAGSSSSCLGDIRDCVGKTGDCPVVTRLEDCNNFTRQESNNIIHDCVGKTGDCPVVTKLEDCSNFTRQLPNIKDFEDVSLGDPEALFETPKKSCYGGNDNLKDKVDQAIKLLIEVHNALGATKCH